MGGGIGSASMMAASVGSIVAVFPDEVQKITAFAGAANLMTSVIGIYFSSLFPCLSPSRSMNSSRAGNGKMK